MYQKQRGATFWSWLVVGAMASVYIVVGVQLVPVYKENISVKQALKNLKNVNNLSLNKDTVYKHLSKQFNIDNVDRIKKEHIKIVRKKGRGGKVHVIYDVKISIFGSDFSLVVDFDESVTL